MKKRFLSLGASMFFLFTMAFHSLAANAGGNGSTQRNQLEHSGEVHQFQFQQSNPINDLGPGPSTGATAGAMNGLMQGAGPLLNVTGAEPFDVVGTVVTCVPGGGFELVIGEGENLFVFGIGPIWFWEAVGVERPAVGDEIGVVGFAVNYSGTLRNIAVTIVTDGNEVLLRDEQGYPLWRTHRALRIGQPNQTTP